MTTFVFANNAAATLAAPISAGATSITLTAGQGALFPNPSGGQQFALTLVDKATGLLSEIVYCTARSGDVLTVVRAQESTTALSWVAGDFANNYLTAGTASSFQQTSGGGVFYAQDTGTTNALVVTLSPAPANQAALVGVPIYILVAHTNTIDTPTLNANGFGAHNITSYGTSGAGIFGVGTGSIGKIIEVIWDGTQYQYTGRIVTATTAQIQAGTDVVSPITSIGLAGAMPHSSLNTTSNYQTLPSGIIIQFGVFTLPTGNADAISLPIAFPTRGVSVVATPANYSGTLYSCTSGFTNNSTLVVSTFNSAGSVASGIVIHWMAMGY